MYAKLQHITTALSKILSNLHYKNTPTNEYALELLNYFAAKKKKLT